MLCKEFILNCTTDDGCIELRELDVKDLLRKSYRIFCVTRQESIHAVAKFPTRDNGSWYRLGSTLIGWC